MIEYEVDPVGWANERRAADRRDYELTNAQLARGNRQTLISIAALIGAVGFGVYLVVKFSKKYPAGAGAAIVALVGEAIAGVPGAIAGAGIGGALLASVTEDVGACRNVDFRSTIKMYLDKRREMRASRNEITKSQRISDGLQKSLSSSLHLERAPSDDE